MSWGSMSPRPVVCRPMRNTPRCAVCSTKRWTRGHGDGARGDGFQQLTLCSWDPKADAKHFETLAEISGRPIMFEAIATQDRFPHRHRNTIKWLERCRQRGLRVYGQGVTTDAGLSFTFEDWNLFDDSDAWREATTGTVKERAEKLGDPRRREALKNQMPREGLITSD